MADTFDAIDADVLDTLYDELGETVTYNGNSATAITSISYQQIGRDAMAVEDRATFNLRYSEIASPSRGDIIISGGSSYTVDSILRVDALEFVAVTH